MGHHGFLVVQYRSDEPYNNFYYSTFAIKSGSNGRWLELASYEGYVQQPISSIAEDMMVLFGLGPIDPPGVLPAALDANHVNSTPYAVAEGNEYCVIRLLAHYLKYIVPKRCDKKLHLKYGKFLKNLEIPDNLRIEDENSIFRIFYTKYLNIYWKIGEFFSSELKDRLRFIFLLKESSDLRGRTENFFEIKLLKEFGFKVTVAFNSDTSLSKSP